MSDLFEIVERIRREQQLTIEVPHFDPKNGNENARFLFVMEAPGQKRLKADIFHLKIMIVRLKIFNTN